MKNIFWTTKRLSNYVFLKDCPGSDREIGEVLFDFLKTDESMENLREKTIEGLFSKIAAGTYSTKAGFFDFFHLSFIAARRLYAKMGAKKVGDVWYIDDVPWFKHFTWASRTYCAYLFTVVFEAGNHVSKR